jgi:hypothetical protein
MLEFELTREFANIKKFQKYEKLKFSFDYIGMTGAGL